MKKRTNLRRSLCLMMALLMAVGIGLPGRANAEAPVEITAKTTDEQNKTVLTDLRVTGLSAPQPGQPFPSEATVVSAESVSWQIPVLWTDANGIPVSGIAGEGPYFPVLVFFVPAEYAVRGSDGKIGSFQLTMDPSVLALFGTDNLFSVYDADRGITYILNGKTNAAVVQREASVMPSEPVPGLPEKFQAPKDGYRNPRYVGPVPDDETEEPEEAPRPASVEEAPEPVPAEEPEKPAPTEEAEKPAPAEEPVNPAPGEEPVSPAQPDEEIQPAPAEEAPIPAPTETHTPEVVTVHCSKTATDAMNTEDLAKLVDLIKYRLQPQATELLRTSFPAYGEAAQNNQLGSQIGLYVYYEKGDKDGISAHETIMDGALASVMGAYEQNENGTVVYQYILNVNARSFAETDQQGNLLLDETGKARLATKEADLACLEATIVHEMMHMFMHDYNRSGMSGVIDPDVMGFGREFTQEVADAYGEHLKRVSFPTWFMEGLATSVENNYTFRMEAFNLLSYAGPGTVSDWYTTEILKNAYTTTSFQVDPNEPASQRYFELETGEHGIPGNKEQMSYDAQYVSGYLACLYLGELAANREGRTAAYRGDDGYTAFDSSVIRDGINTVLKRLHNGETLDDMIRDLSNGEFADTTDFEQKFIKESDDSAIFFTDYLNFMRALAQDKTREFLPSGSVLFPFDADYSSPLDRTKDGESNLFRIADSNEMVESTADMSYVPDAGRSLSYNEYMMELRVIEEERAKLSAQMEKINGIADEVTAGDDIDPSVYDYIMNAVYEAQIVDEETRQTILETAKKMQDDLAAEAAEQAAAETSDEWLENPGEEISDEWAENPDESETWDEDIRGSADEWDDNASSDASAGDADWTDADWSSSADDSADYGDWSNASDYSDWDGGYGYGDWSDGADYGDWGGAYDSSDWDFAA